MASKGFKICWFLDLFTWVVVVVTEEPVVVVVVVVVVEVVVVVVVVAVEVVSDGQVDGQNPYSPSMWVPALLVGGLYQVMEDEASVIHNLQPPKSVIHNLQPPKSVIHNLQTPKKCSNLVVEVEHQGALCPTEVQAL